MNTPAQPVKKHNHAVYVVTISVTLIILAAMFCLTVLFVLRGCANQTENIAKYFGGIPNQTIKNEFISTETKLAGTLNLQVASINQVELFERTDQFKKWGIPFPDVIVSARAPVEYIYYLDLTDPDLDFKNSGNKLDVIAPAIKHNKPSVDTSAITYKVEKGSILRDEKAVTLALRSGITAEVEERANQNTQIAREAARHQLGLFVQKFLKEKYKIENGVTVSVWFKDEIQQKNDASVPQPTL